MANILLGVTGSVAAIRTPMLIDLFSVMGHQVKVVATQAACYFFDVPAWRSVVHLDEDEWPGEAYERGQPVLHVELRNWADVLVVAPLDANTLAKFAVGLCDNCLTCVWRAWDWNKPVFFAPAMNTLMWQHPFTTRHLKSIAADFGAGHIPGHLDGMQLIEQINARSKRLQVLAPVSKELACGDVGIGAMAEVPTIVNTVNAWLATASS